MASIRCLKCGKVNKEENDVCEKCGEKLLKGQEYEEKLRELRDCDDYHKKYGTLWIILSVLLLFLLCPVVRWFTGWLFSLAGIESLPPVLAEYAAPFIMLLVFLMAVMPVIIGRRRIWRRYSWTNEKMRSLQDQLRLLGKDFSWTSTTGDDQTARASRIKGPPVLLLVIVWVLVILVFMERYTEYKPLGYISSVLHLGIGSCETVSGRYECHYSQQNAGGGVARSEQTWAYVFRSDHSFTTYLEGQQQFPGTWSQSGCTLTIHTPATSITPKRTTTHTVSRDGNSFSVGNMKYVKVPAR